MLILRVHFSLSFPTKLTNCQLRASVSFIDNNSEETIEVRQEKYQSAWNVLIQHEAFLTANVSQVFIF